MLTWNLTKRQLGDFELITLGACAPLKGFMNQEEYTSVVRDMHLPSGEFFSMPMVLDMPADIAKKLGPGERLLLKSPTGDRLGEMVVSEVWQPDKETEAELVYRTRSVAHSGVYHLFNEVHPYYVGGTLENVTRYQRFGFGDYFVSPAQMRDYIQANGFSKVAVFHTRNPLHCAHWKICEGVIEESGAHLLLHPVLGSCQSDDVDFSTRMRCYSHVVEANKSAPLTFAACPIVMRMAGPRECLWHALIRRNYGATHFIVGREHASPSGCPGVYGAYDAHEMANKYAEKIGIEFIKAKEYVYCTDTKHFVEREGLAPNANIEELSGSRIRALLKTGRKVPEWLTFPSVHEELRYRYPAGLGRGHAMFVVGDDGQETSIVARGIRELLQEQARQGVCLFSSDYLDSMTEFPPKKGQEFLNFFTQSLIQSHGTLIFYNLKSRHYEQVMRLPGHLWKSCFVIHLCRNGGKPKTLGGASWQLPAPDEQVLTLDDTSPKDAVKSTVQWLVQQGFIPNVTEK